MERDIIDGAWWVRQRGPNDEVVVGVTGGVAPKAIKTVGMIGERRHDVGLLAVTSADRLNAGWTASQRVRERGLASARDHVERLMEATPPHCTIVMVTDAHPALLGTVLGHRARALGVKHFGQTGNIMDLYAHYGIDANAIIGAGETMSSGQQLTTQRTV